LAGEVVTDPKLAQAVNDRLALELGRSIMRAIIAETSLAALRPEVPTAAAAPNTPPE
jgi:hypothetical protein